jgi:hypothetical protein
MSNYGISNYGRSRDGQNATPEQFEPRHISDRRVIDCMASIRRNIMAVAIFNHSSYLAAHWSTQVWNNGGDTRWYFTYRFVDVAE